MLNYYELLLITKSVTEFKFHIEAGPKKHMVYIMLCALACWVIAPSDSWAARRESCALISRV